MNRDSKQPGDESLEYSGQQMVPHRQKHNQPISLPGLQLRERPKCACHKGKCDHVCLCGSAKIGTCACASGLLHVNNVPIRSLTRHTDRKHDRLDCPREGYWLARVLAKRYGGNRIGCVRPGEYLGEFFSICSRNRLPNATRAFLLSKSSRDCRTLYALPLWNGFRFRSGLVY